MQFCTGEGDDETNYCFFGHDLTHERESYRSSREVVHLAPKKSKDHRIIPPSCKQIRLTEHNSRKQNSTEKGKLSLSKMTGRKRPESSKEHSKVKQGEISIGISHSSAPKPAPIKSFREVLANSTNGIHYLNNQHRFQIDIPERPAVFAQPIAIQKRVTVQPPQTIISYRSSQPEKSTLWIPAQVDQQCIPPNSNPPPTPNIIIHGPPTSRPSQPQPQKIKWAGQQEMHQSNHHRVTRLSHLKNSSRQSQSQSRHLRDSQLLKIGDFSYMESELEEKHVGHIAESRYSKTNKLEGSHLVTLQSMYSEDGRKSVHESIVLVDYFNPSQSVKRQIDERIYCQKSSHQDFFGL